jgi:hypothetical protein
MLTVKAGYHTISSSGRVDASDAGCNCIGLQSSLGRIFERRAVMKYQEYLVTEMVDKFLSVPQRQWSSLFDRLSEPMRTDVSRNLLTKALDAIEASEYLNARMSMDDTNALAAAARVREGVREAVGIPDESALLVFGVFSRESAIVEMGKLPMKLLRHRQQLVILQVDRAWEKGNLDAAHDLLVMASILAEAVNRKEFDNG